MIHPIDLYDCPRCELLELVQDVASGTIPLDPAIVAPL